MIAAALAPLVREIAAHTQALGRAVRLDPARVLDRSDSIALAPPSAVSPNRACRLLETASGWIAVNLARPEDVELLSAWLGVERVGLDWQAIAARVRQLDARELLAQARLLSMPVAIVGECSGDAAAPRLARIAPGGAAPSALRVLDLSALWAGPLCAAVFAEAGADVLRLESARRPEARDGPHYRRLNGRKRVECIDWSAARIIDEMRKADLIITSARPRAFHEIGIDPLSAPILKPHAVWVAISGYGWTGDQSDRVAFGDDAAAAAGLVTWDADGAPRFLGDALADPITGIAAAAAALRAVSQGGGVLVDAALTQCAANLRSQMRSAA